MNLRINLLKDTEYRYQGAVSHKFIVQIVLMVGVAVSFIVVALALFHVRSIRQDLEWNREQWENLRPKFKHVNEMQEDLDANTALIASLKSHVAAKLEWENLLQDFRLLVPPSIQLKRFQVGVVDQTISKPPARHIPNALPETVPGRRYDITLQGVAIGESPNETILQFLNGFSTSASFADILEETKLQAMQRDGKSSGPYVSFTFTIVGSTVPMEMVWTGTD